MTGGFRCIPDRRPAKLIVCFMAHCGHRVRERERQLMAGSVSTTARQEADLPSVGLAGQAVSEARQLTLTARSCHPIGQKIVTPMTGLKVQPT
jgi:hypothetical protein